MSLIFKNFWSILLQTAAVAPRSLLLLLAMALPSQAILDLNGNGVSDLWEKRYNAGNLYPTYDPTADPDGDGWANEIEAVAGTDPLKSTSPVGGVRPVITHIPAVYTTGTAGELVVVTPEAITLTWPTVLGKIHTLQYSPDLSPHSWILVRNYFNTNGNPITRGIQLAATDGTRPDTGFWRVIIKDMDTDNDRLTNTEESQLGTHPSRRDSDGDGVSDWDEVTRNFTNPLTAADADADTIPDDFEKALSAKLLLYKPDPVAWATRYAGLIAGNLDATHDYTGDGTTAAQLFVTLSGAGSVDPLTTRYLTERQANNAKLEGTYIIAYEGNPGQDNITFTQTQFVYPFTNISSIQVDQTTATAAYLGARSSTAPWYRNTNPASRAFNIYDIAGMTSLSYFQALDYMPTSYSCRGSITQERFRLCAMELGHEPLSIRLLRVTSQRPYIASNVVSSAPATILSVEPLNVEISTNSMLSDWIELKPPLTPNAETTQSIATLEVTWQPIDGWDNVSDHIDPWTNMTNGKRIFPDFRDPADTEIRHKLQVIVKTSPDLYGQTIYVKAFDVDDSTPETFDHVVDGTAPVIDTNDKAGDDNFNDYLLTPQNGQFWNETTSAWSGNTAQGTVDANGETKFHFRVGMQPGNNYRVVASATNESMYAGVQTTNPATAKYLGPEASQNGGAAASPLLTVWRRLWVENDSMGTIPANTFGYKRNDLSHDLSSPAIITKLSDGTSTSFGIPAITDRSSFSNLENGRIIVQSTEHPVIGTILFGNTHFVQVSGDLSNVPLGSGFLLYDDDDFGLDAAPLPRNNLVDELMKSFFKPSFIEITDSGSFNTRKTVSFRINDDLQSSTVVNSSKDLSEQDALWVCQLTAAYQFNYEEDGDPIGEERTFGGTRQFSNYDHSTVFIETCRDQYDHDFRLVAQGGNPQTGVNARINLRDYISAIASHEMGHQPGNISGDAEHEEGGIMEGRPLKMGINPLSPKMVEFLAKSVLRFRKTHNWSKK